MLLSKLSLVVLCMFLVSGIFTKQATPFSPIHPGTIHADHFSPLQGDGVYVEQFIAQDFSSFTLDFASLNSQTPVEFDIAGGIKFNNDNFEISTEGAIIVESEVNNLNIEAPSGQALFQGEAFVANTYGSDIVFESVNQGINVDSEFGDLTLAGAGIFVEGNFRDGGVFLSSENELDFITSASTYNSGSESIDFSGRSIMLEGNGITADSDADMYFYALNKLDLDSDGAMNLGSNDLFEVLALSGPMSVEAANLNVQAPDFVYQATGSMSLSSVLGGINLTGSSSIDIKSEDQVKFASNEMGIYTNAGGDINFTAGDSVTFASSSADDTSAWVISNRFILDSTLDEVSVHATENLSFTANDVTLTANEDAHIVSQNSYTVTSSGSITHDIDRNMLISSVYPMTFNAGSGNIEIDVDDDLFIVTDSQHMISANGISFTVEDDIDIEVQSDFFLTAAGSLDIDFSNAATISGDFEVDMNSSGDVNINAEDIDFESGHSTHLISDGSATFTVTDDVQIDAPFSTRFESGNFDFSGSDDMSITSVGNFDFHIDALLTVEASVDIDFTSALDFNYFGNDWSVTAVTDVELFTARDYHLFAHDEIFFQSNGVANVANVAFEAGDNIRVSGGSIFASGDAFDMNVNDWFVFARNSILFEAASDIEVDIGQLLSLGAAGDVVVNASDVISFVAGNNMLIDTTVLYHGDIEFNTESGDITLDISDDFDVISGRVEAYAGVGLSMDIDSISIIHKDYPTDFGNIIFSSNSTFDVTALTEYIIQARTIEFYGMNSAIFSASETIDLETFNNNDINFQAGQNILLTSSGDFSISSPVVDINAAEFATITSDGIGAGISISGDSFTGHSSMGTSYSSLSAVDLTFNSFSWTALSYINATIGDFDVFAGDLSLSAYGSGVTMVAQDGVTLSALNIESQTGDHLSFLSMTGRSDLTASVNVISNGGAQTISSAMDMTWTSAGEFDIITRDNGFLKFISGSSITTTAASSYGLSGFVSDLTETEGRFGTIKSTAADANICIHSTDVGSTGFVGDAVEWNAYGPDAEIMAESTDAMTFESDIGSIGMTAFGWVPTDPQFLFDPEVTFGILYRTAVGNTNPITVSGDADFSAYAGDDILVSALSVTGTTSEGMDFRTYDQFADIVVDVTNGDVLFDYDNVGYFTSGNALLPADMTISATKDISIDSSDSITVNHLGTTTDIDDAGIVVESFDTMSYDTSSFEVTVNDHGTINMETRGGDVFFQSLTGQNQLIANTGSINMVVRGDASFLAEETIDIGAAGDGGSVSLSSGGEQLFSILATDSKFFVTADQGEIDFEATTGFDITASVDILFESDVLNMEGGSVLFTALTSLDMQSDEELTMDAEIQFTVDSAVINIVATEGIDMSAGGNGITSGITATSVGDISYDSSNGDVSLAALRTFITTANTTSFVVEEDVFVKSRSNSAADNTITLEATLGNSLILAEQFSSKTVENSITARDTTLTADRATISSESASLETSSVGLWSVLAENDFNNVAENIQANIGGSIDIIATVDDIEWIGDYSLEMIGNGVLTMDSDVFLVDAVQSSFLTQSVGALTMTMTGDFTASSGGLFDVHSPSSITLETLGDSFSMTSRDDFILSARNDIILDTLANAFVFAENFQVYSDNFFATQHTLTTFSANNFDMYAYNNINFEGVDVTLLGVAGQRIDFNFRADNELSLTTDLFSMLADDVFFTATNNDDTGVDFDVSTFTSTSIDFNMISKRDILIDTTTLLTVNTETIDLISHGQNGIVFDSLTLEFTNTNNADFLTDSGNIEFYSNGNNNIDFTALTDITYTTTHPFGDIVLDTQGFTTTFTSTADFIVQQYSPYTTQDSTQSGTGLMVIEGNALELTGGNTLSFLTDSDFTYTSRSFGTSEFEGATVNVEGGNIVHVDTYSSIDMTATSLAVSATTPTFGEIHTSSNEVEYNAAGNIGISAAFIDFESSGIIETIAFSTVFSSGSDFNARANRGVVAFDSANIIEITSNDLRLDATGTDGRLSFEATGGIDVTAVQDIFFTAEDSIHWPVNNIVTNDLTLISGSDIVFDSTSLTVNAVNANFATSYDGNFKMNSHAINIATTDDLTFIGFGNLGTIGGRYVIEDYYFQKYAAADQHERINRNTNGIEVNNVNGDVIVTVANTITILSEFASIEFKAADTIRYLVPNNGRIWFFGVDTANVANAGAHRVVPFTQSNDYCADGGCSTTSQCGGFNIGCPNSFNGSCVVNCTELSGMINDIISAMVSYGLLECTGTSGFCF